MIKKAAFSLDTKEKSENKLIDWMAVSAAGQLIISKPEDGKLVDLVIKKRGEYEKSTPIYIKVIECEKKGDNFEAKIVEVGREERLYIILTYFDMVAQDIFEYVWLLPSEKFIEMAEQEEGEFVFRSPTDVKKDSPYFKYLISKREVGRLVYRIVNQGKRFLFPQTGLTEFTNIKLDDLKEFLVEARRATYAGGGVPVDNSKLQGAKEFVHIKGDWYYQDIYFAGLKNLIGQEVVYYNQKPIWSMVYFGDQIKEETAEFLKAVLSESTESCRVGNRFETKKKSYTYEDFGEGTLEKFFGEERINYQTKNIYKLKYQGGFISK